MINKIKTTILKTTILIYGVLFALLLTLLSSCGSDSDNNQPAKGEFELIILNYQGDTLEIVECSGLSELDNGVKYTDTKGKRHYTNLPVIGNYE